MIRCVHRGPSLWQCVLQRSGGRGALGAVREVVERKGRLAAHFDRSCTGQVADRGAGGSLLGIAAPQVLRLFVAPDGIERGDDDGIGGIARRVDDRSRVVALADQPEAVDA